MKGSRDLIEYCYFFKRLYKFSESVIFLDHYNSYVASMGTSDYKTNAQNVTSDGVNYYLTRVPCDTNVSKSAKSNQYKQYEYNLEYLLVLFWNTLWH